MPQEPRRGVLIVFEGGEGGGKSTQAGMLGHAVAGSGREVVLTREPGGSARAEAIRELILADSSEDLPPRAEALLFAAARADHVAMTIQPALERGAVVICDRFVDSSVAYQGHASEMGVEWIRALSAWATDGLIPDLTVVLDVDPRIGLARAKDANRLERQPLWFHERVRDAFRDMAAAEPARYSLLDAAADPAAVHRLVWERVQPMVAAS